MNKIISSLALSSLLLVACTNQPTDFDDFTTQTAYFPIQYPIRTLVLGEDRLDNSIDLQKAFNIGVSVGGLYDNRTDRTIGFEVAPGLFPDVAQGMDTIYAKDPNNVEFKIMPLPTNYYTLTPENKVVVPAGSFSGLIRVNLTDDFFNDPNAFKLNYVVPLRVTDASHNFTILKGEANDNISAPRWYVGADWKPLKAPKDYTLFAIKFINPWHGTFFHRGVQKKDGLVDKVFHAVDISANQVAKFETVGLKKVTYDRMGEKTGAAFRSVLTFDDDVNGVGNVVVSALEGSPYTISGTGKFYKSSTAFGKENGWVVDPLNGQVKGALTVTVDYTVQGLAGATIHQFTDTLVLRSNDVRYQEYTVVAKPKK